MKTVYVIRNAEGEYWTGGCWWSGYRDDALRSNTFAEACEEVDAAGLTDATAITTISIKPNRAKFYKAIDEAGIAGFGNAQQIKDILKDIIRNVP